MKEFLHKCVKFWNDHRRDLVIFLPALLLAFSIWLIHNLSLKYTEIISVPVVAKCNLDHCKNISENACNITARASASGYDIIRLNRRSNKNRVPRTVSFDRNIMHHENSDVYYITSRDLKEYSQIIFGEEVRIDYYITDTLRFRFPQEESKKVPVIPTKVMTFIPQFMLSENLTLEPDSVTVFGEKELLDRVDCVRTSPIKKYDIESSFHGKTKIKKIKGIRMSDESVYYSANVTRYTEVEEVLPIYATNVPQDKEFKYYPASIKLTLKCIFPINSSPFTGVVLYLDYNDYINSLSGKCPVYVDGLGNEVLDYSLEFSTIGCFTNDIIR